MRTRCQYIVQVLILGLDKMPDTLFMEKKNS